MTEARDVVVVGSGHNGPVAAAYLARAGLSVEVLERSELAGGAVRSEELTEPGLIHDTFSATHTIFKLSMAWAELGDELVARGLRYCETPNETTATVLPDGRVALAYRDIERTVAEFDERDRGAYLSEINRFGAMAPVAGEMLATELFSLDAAKLAWRMRRNMKMDRRAGLAFAADMLASTRAWLEARFVSHGPADLYAPWALHPGLSPDSAGSGFQVLGIAGVVHEVGLPIVEGRSQNHVRALERLIADHGGCVRTNVEVERILTRGGTAIGVIADGEEVRARLAVVANTGPNQLYGQLLEDGVAPREAMIQARRYRYNERAGTQIHVALTEPLRRRDSRLENTAIIHLNGGLDRVSLACAQASAGLLPAEPTVVVGLPAVLDPSRAPDGAALIWIQRQQVPYAPRGDAGAAIDRGTGPGATISSRRSPSACWPRSSRTWRTGRGRAAPRSPSRHASSSDATSTSSEATSTAEAPISAGPISGDRSRPGVWVSRHPDRSSLPLRRHHLSQTRPPRGVRADRRPPDPESQQTTRTGAAALAATRDE